MKKFILMCISLFFITAISLATGCAKDEQSFKTQTELNAEFHGKQCIFVYKLTNSADVENVSITVTEKDVIIPEWISRQENNLFNYKGYVISNTMRYNGKYLFATTLNQKDYDRNRCSDEILLNSAKFDYKPISECWELKFQSANLKTLISAIDTGLNSNNFYRKL